MPGFLHNTYAVLRRELVRLTHQPMYFVLMLVLPVVSFAFFALLFNKGVARDIPIAVLDEDHTSLSRKVTQMIDATPTALVAYEIQDMDEGERLMREGKVMAIVQIPSFFPCRRIPFHPSSAGRASYRASGPASASTARTARA